MDAALLDTDILSEILKQRNPLVASVGSRYLIEYGRFAFSAITFYEVFRGFRVKKAGRALSEFNTLAANSDVVAISIPVLLRAADLWAEARRGGHPRGDADLIIAATALESQRVLVTGNRAHFEWIEGMSLEDWRSGVD
jgi:tRNA(fMet)-specific endonuclease VapC